MRLLAFRHRLYPCRLRAINACPGGIPRGSGFFRFTKAGFLVALNLSGKKTHVEVNLSHLGNVDARRLPKPADGEGHARP